jgi:hypothetical protein
MAHSWFQHVLASNESKHGWMDEVYFILEDFGLDAIADKSRKPILGGYLDIFDGKLERITSRNTRGSF